MSKKFIYIDASGFSVEANSYESTDYINSTAGAADAAKPILTDAGGQIDSSFINFGSIDHGALTGLADDGHTQYIRVDGTRAFTGNQSMGGNLITSVATPISANDAVNKAYADSLRTENGMKGNVDVATTANIALTGEQTIDGFLTSASRILVKDQTDPKENGIYVTAAGAWARSEDMDNSPTAEIVNGVLIPRVQNSASGQEVQSFYISSVGTGVDSVHTIGVDNIVFDLYTTSTQLSSGDGIIINGTVIEVDLAATDPGLFFDGSSDLGIDWSTAFNDAKAIKASDLASVANAEGASIIGIEDSAGNYTATDVEAALAEVYDLASVSTGEHALAGAAGVAKGDLIYYSAADTVLPLTITTGLNCVGVALNTATSGNDVRYARWDELVSGAIAGAVAGTKYYWSGSALTTVQPTTSGNYVWLAGIAKNATDLLATVEFVKKNI